LSLPTPVGASRETVIEQHQYSSRRNLIGQGISPEHRFRTIAEQETPQLKSRQPTPDIQIDDFSNLETPQRKVRSMPTKFSEAAEDLASATYTKGDCNEIDLVLTNKPGFCSTHLIVTPPLYANAKVTQSNEGFLHRRHLSYSLAENADSAGQGSMPNLHKIDVMLGSREPNRCSQQQALSQLSPTVPCIKQSTPPALTNGRLYNENFINAYTNDPFAATTTVDPFLSPTMYLDEGLLILMEKAFKKWLNALVTIPADLETDKNEKVDIGKLFTELQKKELTLAPTKENVCSTYYTSRLDQLRSTAVKFFHSEEVSIPLKKITVNIEEKKQLEIRNDRHIHLDFMLQRNLLELILCFNPLWLRIGLEVVFNVQLNLSSNHDILGISRFIITHMFKCPYLEQKYSKFAQQKQEYLDKLKKFTVKNFLFVLFFLDRAKNNRLIKQNPCLFVKKAPYKESAEILKRFASLTLANYGDIIRHLRRLDYLLTHKQTHIDEYDYAFNNLAVDIRDGVRLAKVMEIILLRDDLVKFVRVPAISRLQKVFNVDLALKALQNADYTIVGDITAKDIADGHREKTLSLLWQLIYKFRAPKFNAAAATIQKFWRSKWLMIVIQRRIRQKKEERLNRAATIIQKVS